MLSGPNTKMVKIYGDRLVIERFYGCWYLEDLAVYSISDEMDALHLSREDAVDSLVRKAAAVYGNLIR